MNMQSEKTMADEALSWHRFGLVVIPLPPGMKHSAMTWDSWTSDYGPEKIAQHWAENERDGVGTLMTRQVIVFDADTPEAEEALEAIEKAHGIVCNQVHRTSKGVHHFYRRTPDVEARNDSCSTDGHPEGIDIKTAAREGIGTGCGAGLVVLPPGAGRSVEKGVGSTDELVEVGQDFVDAIRAHNAATAPQKHRPTPIANPRPLSTPCPEEVEYLVGHISPNCGYDDWRTVGMALQDKLGDAGLAVWDSWSSGGQSYPGPEELGKKWATFTPGGITFRTLCHMAEAAGADLRKFSTGNMGFSIPESSQGKAEHAPDIEVSILDDAPEIMARPVSRVDGNTYISTWASVQTKVHREVDGDGKETEYDPPKVETRRRPIILRDDGEVFCNSQIGIPHLPLIKTGIDIRVREVSAEKRNLSGRGLKAYIKGTRPDPVQLHRDISDVCDRFMDFTGSFANQRAMCDLMACYIMSTAFLDAFPVIGYLWFYGDPGSGKTQGLKMVSMMGHLSTLIANSATTAALRDIASAGGAMCIDDAEKITGDGVDPEKQSLMLAGNQSDVTVPIREPGPDGKGWITVHYPVYCARCFSATTLPIDTLRSRSIIIPVLASDDETKTNATPEDDTTWPRGITQRSIIDRMWMVALNGFAEVESHDRLAMTAASVQGRAYQPWRAVMGIAHWLDGRGSTGLFDRMSGALKDHANDAAIPKKKDRGTIVIMALADLVEKKTGNVEISTAAIKSASNRQAREEDVPGAEEGPEGFPPDAYNTRQIGRTLSKLRFEQSPNRRDQRAWIIPVESVRRLIRAGNMANRSDACASLSKQTSHTSQTSQTSQEGPNSADIDQNPTDLGGSSDITDVSDISDVSFLSKGNATETPQEEDFG